MTPLRPEREGRPYEPYESAQSYAPEQPPAPQEPYDPLDPYGRPDAFEAAVGQLSDPLNDPLPGQGPQTPSPDPAPYEQPGRPAPHTASAGSPWFQPHRETEQPGVPAPQPAPEPDSHEATPRRQRAFGPESAASARSQGHGYGPGYETYAAAEPAPEPYAAPQPPAPASPPSSSGPQRDDETMALRQAEERGARRDRRKGVDGDDVSRETTARETDAVSRETSETPAEGGRAARRKAAQEAAKRGGRRGRHGAGATAATAAAKAASAPEPPAVPTSRLEARRAARAAKDSLSLIVSRAVGEVFISLGVLMLLFVTYQLWWTNVMADEEAGGAATTLQHQWDKGGGEKKNLAVGERFGIMYIPKLDVKAPIAEGIDKHNVLDHGMVGHYDKSSGIKTAMPWDKKGNFAVAAHRNTHGEPFRYVNKLTKGDKIVVETQSAYYTYEMESILPQTSPSNTSVIGPVPPGSGFTGPGRYITLTTCTPEFTSTFRMIVWGKMVDERPRSKGKPAALTG
ncbi:class E sortase [Streptomyces sp. NPDC101227]|uniref:class E sortase n=1 Tax=Streptomyces sp. NPDC101227 TaxID=3366136 RepID=UPI003828DDFE